MRTIKVLVWNGVGSVPGTLVWLANGLEHDIAAQGATLEAAMEALGECFDGYDAILRERAERIEPPPEAPKIYFDCWDVGENKGRMPLGVARTADVRRATVDPYERYVRETCR